MDMNLNEQLAGADLIIDDLEGVEAATAPPRQNARGGGGGGGGVL